MLLTLVRHAPAADAEGRGAEADAARSLTPRGRRRFKDVRQALRAADLSFDRMLFSPLARAVETAELLMPLVRGPAHAEPGLVGPPKAALLAQLAALDERAQSHPVLVGHQPHLGELAAWLAFGRPQLGAGLDLKKGGVVLLEGTPRPRGMRLLAVLPPGLLRRWA